MTAVLPDESKNKCPRCGEQLASGNCFSARCKRAASVARWRANNLETRRATDRAYRQKYADENPERARAQNAIKSANRRAKAIGSPGRITYADWIAALEHHRNACAYCGTGSCLLDLDHIDALSDGGDNVAANIAPACRPCNAQKHARTLAEFCALRGIDETAIRARACMPAADR